MADKSSKEPFDGMRARLLQRIQDRGLSLKSLSMGAGYNHAYLQQFIYRGTPQKLPEDVRAYLSKELDWPESEMGGPQRRSPESSPSTDNFEISDDVFRACFEPLIFQFAGKKVAAGLNAEFYARTNRDLHEAMAYLREHEPAVSVTSHLSQFLLLALGSMLGANPLSSEFDYPRWRKSTDAAAQLALTLMDDDRPRKSG